MDRTIVIGDIHGCYDELIELLNRVTFAPEDRVVAVGDLTVKGPKSREVLDLFSNDPRFWSVLGNHDLALVRHWRGENVSLKASQAAVLADLQAPDDHYLKYLASLPLLINLDSHVVVHAGVRPGVPLEEQAAEDLVQLRTLGEDRTSRKGIPWYEVYDGSPTVLFGHWPASKPRRGKHALGLDTGCVYGGQLTAYVIETGEFFSVAAARAYAD
ncbi:MAG TPA: metallophosphoesterase [Pyrinomonadaceae bacterium]|nr:metallophosphoesterase [Pyrinomonadaceae bacterium]